MGGSAWVTGQGEVRGGFWKKMGGGGEEEAGEPGSEVGEVNGLGFRLESGPWSGWETGSEEGVMKYRSIAVSWVSGSLGLSLTSCRRAVDGSMGYHGWALGDGHAR